MARGSTLVLPLSERYAQNRSALRTTRQKLKAPACAARAASSRSRQDDGLRPKTRGVVTCEVRRKQGGINRAQKRYRTGGSVCVCGRVWVCGVRHVM